MITDNDLSNRFTYHKPTGNQPDIYVEIRGRAYELARYIVENTPDSREQSLAITKLEEAVMWANAGVARKNA